MRQHWPRPRSPHGEARAIQGEGGMKIRPTKKKGNKRPSKKVVSGTVWSDEKNWIVVEGKLKPAAGRPSATERLFQYVGEKLPFECLKEVRAKISKQAGDPEGIYMAHDSMGMARYGGRGKIFNRLHSHQGKYPKELLYFSFYVIKSKKHERELETAILRAAGPQMILNKRKVRSDISPGNVSDYEPGTLFFERQQRRGQKQKRRRKNRK